MAEPHSGNDMRERSIPELMNQLAQETTTLVRKEIDLAKAEVAMKGREAGKGAGLFGAAGAAGLMALGALTACLILALNHAVSDWLAALIVALVWAAAAGILAVTGKDRVRHATPPAPQTMQTVKEDVEWAKTQGRSVRT
jgi:hypothetical protein